MKRMSDPPNQLRQSTTDCHGYGCDPAPHIIIFALHALL
jgi:hypothetical protein